MIDFVLIESLNIEVRRNQPTPKDWYLGTSKGKIALCHNQQLPLTLSEHDIRTRIGQAKQSDITRACRARPGLQVLDAMGGWGIDSLVLASVGCEVTMTEINMEVWTLARALSIETGIHVEFFNVDVLDYLQHTSKCFDVIYLDPFFPPHPKNAKPSRRMQVLEQIAGQVADIERIFGFAAVRARNRIVIKNRRKSPPLIDTPHWEIKGRTVRFDVYSTSAR